MTNDETEARIIADTILTGQGEALDLVGDLLGLTRRRYGLTFVPDESDADYRRALMAWVRTSR